MVAMLMARSAASSVSLMLTQRLVAVDAKPFTPSEFWPLLQAVNDPASLAQLGTDDLAALFDERGAAASAERVAALLAVGPALGLELQRLDAIGITLLTPFDDAWPKRLSSRLGNVSPVVLHAAGPLGLLSSTGLAIVGSRDVSERGAEVARAAARAAADLGFTTISGGARGVDQLAMQAAVEAGGASVGVLADSLERSIRSPETQEAFEMGRGCLATPYAPGARFTAGNAMGRNKIVYALSKATLVVATAEDKGGTWSGATEALRRTVGRVLVWRGDGEGPGNRTLETKGAIAVSSIDDLVERLREPETPSVGTGDSGDGSTQMSLGL